MVVADKSSRVVDPTLQVACGVEETMTATLKVARGAKETMDSTLKLAHLTNMSMNPTLNVTCGQRRQCHQHSK